MAQELGDHNDEVGTDLRLLTGKIDNFQTRVIPHKFIHNYLFLSAHHNIIIITIIFRNISEIVFTIYLRLLNLV